ncbi:MAG: TolC family protein [Bacteroidales bacterium]|nr:TolC family protein [Bacteroidales bacterium]
MKNAIMFICFFLSCIEKTEAQEVWTLEQCIRYACENNIQLKQQQLNTLNAENTLLQSQLSRLPDLNVSGNFSSSRGKVLDQNTFSIVDGETVKSLSGGVSSSVTLFRGLQLKNTVDRNYFALLASRQDTEKLKNDLSLNIVMYYLQIIHAEEQLAVAEQQLLLTRRQAARTAVLVEAGSLPEGNLFDMEAQEAREELQAVTARNTLDMARLNLAQLLDLDTRTDFRVASPEFPDITVSGLAGTVDDIFAHAGSVLPQIKSAEYRMESARESLSVARGARSPSLTLSGGYSTRYSSSASLFDPVSREEYGYPFWRQLRDGVNSYIGIGLGIPLFNGWQINTGVKNARLNLQNAQYQLQLAENTLYKEIQQAHADANAAMNRYAASRKAVAAMEEAFRHTEQRYEVGMMNFLDYHTAKTQLAAAQSELLQAKYEYIFKTKVLDFYQGRPIKL